MSVKTRTAIATFALAGAIAGPLLAGTAHAASLKKLVVAEPVHSTGYLPLYVAIHNGYFKEAGLDIEIYTSEGGGAHTNAVLTKQAFAFIGGPEHNAFAKIKGAELRAVVNVVDRGNVYLVAKKGMGPKKGESLAAYMKGKNIATGFFGGTPNSITRYLLATWKLGARKDVVLKEMSNGAILAAVRTGAATVGVTSEPILTRGIKAGIWEEPFYNVPKELGPYAYSTLNIRLESMKNDPQMVQAFVKAVIRGLKFTYAEPAKAIAVAKKEFPTMSPDDLKATLDRSFADNLWSKDGMISPESWKTGGSVVRTANILKKDVAYDEIIDMKFVKTVLSMLKK
ncbi:MAG: ABC transporter substrate-binding protein [Hyphomicrobiales bacterium]|nr:ABC transporter substrate-binding protein [Hyphomicrobiales bacterium]